MIIDFSKLHESIDDYKNIIKTTMESAFRELEKKLINDNEAVKFILKPFSELTSDERSQMCALYYQKQQKKFNLNRKRNDNGKIENVEYTNEESLAIYKELTNSYNNDMNSYQNIINEMSNNIIITIKKSNINNVNLEKLKNIAEKVLSDGKKVSICIYDQQENNDFNIDYLYSNDQISQIIDLNNHLLKIGMSDQIRFYESSDLVSEDNLKSSWPLEDVIKANENINKVVEHIKNNNYSPFEAMTYIHTYVTSNFKYTEGQQEECRSIVGAYQGKIVCAGYATLVKAIVDELNDPNLKCECIGADIYQKDFLRYKFAGGHAHNLIHIKDEKYDIDGHYMEDTCWDSKNDDYPNGRGFAYFMYPVTDLECFNSIKYQQFFSDKLYDSIFYNGERHKKINSEVQKSLKEALEKPKNYGQIHRNLIKYIDKVFKYHPATPEIVEKYGDKSTPIPLETLRKVIFTVYSNIKALDKNALENEIEETLALSVQRAKRGFTSKASGSLVTTKKYRKAQFSRDNKRKPTFAELDGRQ